MKPTPSNIELVDFEWWSVGRSQRQKVRAIRERWGLSESQYIVKLSGAIDTVEALAYMPTFVTKLRRERDERRALRTGATARHAGDAGPDPRQATLADITPRRDGAQEKQAGMALADDAASAAWKAAWDGAIEKLAAAGQPFTADDVREIAGDPTDHPNAAGSRFLRASKRGLIRRYGFRPSARASLHAHNIAVWIGADVKEVAS